MANPFTAAEWQAIFTELSGKESHYGLPQRKPDSLVLGSWNIRKFGAIDPNKRDDHHFKFITSAVSHFDLLAIQEVMDDLQSIRRLLDDLNKDIRYPANQYGLVLSDITGAIPGGAGVRERLAFLYRRDRVRRTEVASDISVDRKAVLDNLHQQVGNYVEALVKQIADLTKHRKKLLAWAKSGSRKRAPDPPTLGFIKFLTFIRSPYCVSFELWPAAANPYLVMAVSAHLVYGVKKERELEFDALLSWLGERLVTSSRAYYPNFVLMGDLNLNVRKPADLLKVDQKIKDRAGETAARNKAADVYFPFVTPHPTRNTLLRTTARLKETYDQIGFFTVDNRLPKVANRHTLGVPAALEDYGVFNFSDLFAQVIHSKQYPALNDAQKEALVDRYQDTVSDHLPLWVRLKKPV